jgi:hypothetical protein
MATVEVLATSKYAAGRVWHTSRLARVNPLAALVYAVRTTCDNSLSTPKPGTQRPTTDAAEKEQEREQEEDEDKV